MTSVVKHTIAFPADVDAALEAALGQGHAEGNRSALVATAVRAHLRELRRRHLHDAASRLDPALDAAHAPPAARP